MFKSKYYTTQKYPTAILHTHAWFSYWLWSQWLRKLGQQRQCKQRKSYFNVVQDSEEGFPNLCQVLNEVVCLSPTDQVIQSQTAGGQETQVRANSDMKKHQQLQHQSYWPMLICVQVYVYLDSRTLHMLLVRFEMTSCKISFAYLSTCQKTRHLHQTGLSWSTCTVAVCLEASVRNWELRTMVLSVTSASQMLVMAWRMPRLGSNWYL